MPDTNDAGLQSDLSNLSASQRSALSDVISWAAEQAEEDEEATIRVLDGLIRECKRTRSRGKPSA